MGGDLSWLAMGCPLLVSLSWFKCVAALGITLRNFPGADILNVCTHCPLHRGMHHPTVAGGSEPTPGEEKAFISVWCCEVCIPPFPHNLQLRSTGYSRTVGMVAMYLQAVLHLSSVMCFLALAVFAMKAKDHVYDAYYCE